MQNVEHVFDPDRKDTRWGKRKRDEEVANWGGLQHQDCAKQYHHSREGRSNAYLFKGLHDALPKRPYYSRWPCRRRTPWLFLALFSSSCTVGRLNNPILNAFVLHPLITMPDRQSCCPVPDSKSKQAISDSRLRNGFRIVWLWKCAGAAKRHRLL